MNATSLRKSRSLPSPPIGEDPQFKFKNGQTAYEFTTTQAKGISTGFQYLGSLRTITMSGKKPSTLEYSVKSMGKEISLYSGTTIPTGTASATATFTLASDETYRQASITITIIDVDENDIVDI